MNRYRNSLGLFAALVAGIGLVASAAACSGDDSPTNPQDRVGGISGTLAYPGDDPEGGPSQGVVAFNDDTGKLYWVNVAKTGPYTLKELPPGTYGVVAYALGQAGGYSEAVACGLGPNCMDHSLVQVIVQAGEVTADVNPVDWYAPEGSFPARPDEVVVPDDGPDVPAGCTFGREACELAARLEQWAVDDERDAFAVLIEGGATQAFVCDGQAGDFRLYPLCDGAPAGEERRGFPRALHGSEGGAITASEFTRIVSELIAGGARLGSAGCGTGSGGCDTFVAAFATGGQPAAMYIALQRDAEHGAYFVSGIGLSGDNADIILDGGTTQTVAGEVAFSPWPATPVR